MSAETPNPQPDDTVRIVLDGAYVREGDPTDHDGGFAGHLVRVDGVLLYVPLSATVDVLERADDPSKDEIGTVRKGPKSSPVVRCRVMSDDVHPWKSVMYTVSYSHEDVVGWPVIGVVPGTPAAEAQTPVPEWDQPGPRRSVRVPNEPYGLSEHLLQVIRERVTVGDKWGAVDTLVHCTLMDREQAASYVESMSEYQTYLSEHGHTEVDPVEADRMRAMGFDQQPEFRLTDDDRALIHATLVDRMGEYFSTNGFGYRLNADDLTGVVADIVWAAIKRDRERGDR